ncbi:MAG: hydantoinase/oxoprolinase family protein [Thermodesulfobacteriaceae bacterium]|nr:hydantoinase/oxoprolinase family protein [Thermodesulfobacteriaceae bacterium]MDW8136287.1 hydantoinase/oxoprolinase family protein [Thermodesulfobacterium sp.]
MLVAVDTGGTFTDLVYLENSTIKTSKLFSTPKDPSQAVLNILKDLKVKVLIHGTTVGTNAFLERKGAKIAFITTLGFEDLLFIGRQARPSLYDLWVEKPKPIVEKTNCLGIKERVNAKGEVLIPLTSSEVQRIINLISQNPVEAVAICLLHSYLYPYHEKKLKEAFLPLGLSVSISSEILSEFREFERASTTAINAYLNPVIQKYLTVLKEKLPIKIYIQQSNGGWLTAEEALHFSVHTILSGPAGGVNGALIWAKSLGRSKIITIDMGGTSTDVCLIKEELPFTKEYFLDGYPLGIPVIDIHTVGAGGGSIAYVDKGGALKVGPESASAEPGPACYGKGNLPTVTDANLLLGRLLPEIFLGGKFKLQRERAERAIYSIAKTIGLSLEETALGIIKVANINMVRALRKISLERGYDPQEFSLFCYGGAAGLHVCALAKELGIKEIIIPKIAGSFSAFGLLFSPPIKDFSQTVWLPSKETKLINQAVENLKKYALKYIQKFGMPSEDFKFEIFLDLRYKGQGFELTIPFQENYLKDFEEEHYRQFGYTLSGFPVEVVNLRVRLKGKPLVSTWKVIPQKKNFSSFITKVFTEKGFVEVPVISWDSLKIGETLKGPLLVWEDFTTLWVEENLRVIVEDNYTLVLKYEGY